MSGNPFRRQHSSVPTATVEDNRYAEAEDRFPAVEDVGTARRPLVSKKVRIQTPPPLSPDSPPTSTEPGVFTRPFTPTSNTGSPPLRGGGNIEDETLRSSRFYGWDPGDHGGENDDYEVVKNTRINSITSKLSTNVGPEGGRHAAPPNPFQRTLASMEVNREAGSAGVSETWQTDAGSGAAKQSMDVDSFARLIMTGTAGPTSLSKPSEVQPSLPTVNVAVPDSSSSTDTSSISRQSIFEVSPDQESEARSAYSGQPTAEDTKERGRVGESGHGRREKPLPPKHRHGKMVSSNAPQFSSSMHSQPSVASPATLQFPTTPSHDNTPILLPDANGALPEPSTSTSPDAPRKTSDSGSHLDPLLENSIQEAAFELNQRKTAPPPPVARRHSQRRSENKSGRPRSDSTQTLSSQPEESINQVPFTGADSALSSQKPPLPPPARRKSARSSGTAQLIQRSSSPNAISRQDSTETPSRNPSESPVVRPVRTPSISSVRSCLGASQSSMAPPPPPPPRRTSSKSSADHSRPNLTSPESRRFSTEYRRLSQESTGRRVSGSSLRQESNADTLPPLPVSDATARPASAILDDLGALQREVDELRDRYRRAS